MQIDRPTIERELAAVRAQGQQAAAILQQAAGAEKALMAVLTILDMEAPDAAGSGDDIARAAAVAAAKTKTRNGATQ